MAEARIIPTPLSSSGSVLCFVERIDGQVFPEISEVAFSSGPDDPPGTAAPVVLTAGGTRLYFVPPPVDQPTSDQLVLSETGDRLSLESPLTSTADALDSARSLRAQMEVLSEAMADLVAAERPSGIGSEAVLSVYLSVVGDSHLRLADALEGLIAEATPAETIDVFAVIDGLVSENQERMETFVSVAFNF
jgi:hypothetical protein